MSTQFHESLDRSDNVPRSSERSFGILFAVVFLIVAAFPLLDSGDVRWWAVAVALVFAGLGLFLPNILQPLNTAWLGLGKILHKFVSPIVLGFVYLIAVVPTGLFLRLTGRDPLRLKLDKSAKTYWLTREPHGPPPGSLKNQF